MLHFVLPLFWILLLLLILNDEGVQVRMVDHVGGRRRADAVQVRVDGIVPGPLRGSRRLQLLELGGQQRGAQLQLGLFREQPLGLRMRVGGGGGHRLGNSPGLGENDRFGRSCGSGGLSVEEVTVGVGRDRKRALVVRPMQHCIRHAALVRGHGEEVVVLARHL